MSLSSSVATNVAHCGKETTSGSGGVGLIRLGRLFSTLHSFSLREPSAARRLFMDLACEYFVEPRVAPSVQQGMDTIAP
jgi:hypothetical protein